MFAILHIYLHLVASPLFFDCHSAIQKIWVSHGYRNELPAQETELHLLDVQRNGDILNLEFLNVTRTRSRFGYFTEKIVREVRQVSASDPHYKNIPKPLGKQWFWNMIQPHLNLVREEYRRRKFPPPLLEKLDQNSFKYLDESTYVTTYDDQTGEAIGGFRLIRIPYVVIDGEVTPHRLLPVEDYLGFEVPLFTHVDSEAGEGGIKEEIGALAVKHSLPIQKRLRVKAELWINLHLFTRESLNPAINFLSRAVYAYADVPDGVDLYLPIGLQILKKARDGRDIGSEPTERDGSKWLPLIYSPGMMDRQNRRYIEKGGLHININFLQNRRAELLREMHVVDFEPLPTLFQAFRNGRGLTRYDVMRAINHRLELLAFNHSIAEDRIGSSTAEEAQRNIPWLEEEAREIEKFFYEAIKLAEHFDAAQIAYSLALALAAAPHRNALTEETILKDLLFPAMIKGAGDYWTVHGLRAYNSPQVFERVFKPKNSEELESTKLKIEVELQEKGYSLQDLENFRRHFYSIWHHIDEDYSDGFYMVYISQMISKLARENTEDLKELVRWSVILGNPNSPVPEPWFAKEVPPEQSASN